MLARLRRYPPSYRSRFPEVYYSAEICRRRGITSDERYAAVAIR